MPYITGIFDRTQTDIDTRTSKAFLNVADWNRIYTNSSIVISDEVENQLGIAIQFDVISAPTTTTIPTITDLNKLTGNIERARVLAEAIGAETEIKDDWLEGASQDAPDFVDVNLWEKTLDVMHIAYTGNFARKGRTGVAECGVGKTRNNQWRHY